MDKKITPVPMTIDEQVANLKKMGLVIDNEEKVKRFLNDVSYYRIVKAYSKDLKDKTNGQYKAGISFETIHQLYLFNAHFRQLLFPQVEKIEINFRCRLSNYFSLKYGSMAYLDASCFARYPGDFSENMKKEISQNKKAPHIKNFTDNYENGDVPLYAAVEVFTFGTLSKFYKNMRGEDKKALAEMYDGVIRYTFLESWLESIASVRNICAHYGRLYNTYLIKKPSLYDEDWSSLDNKNNRIMAVLLCMKRMLPFDEHWCKFVEALDTLIQQYPVVDIRKLGFPIDWKTLLLCNDR